MADGIAATTCPRCGVAHPQSVETWIEHLAQVIARNRFGSGVDMGGAHNPRPSEVRLAKEFIRDFLAWLEPDPIDYGGPHGFGY